MPKTLKYRILVAVLALLLIGAASAGGAAFWAYKAINAPGPLTEARVYVVPRGAALTSIANGLESAGIIGDRQLFLAYARYRRAHRSLQAGEFEFPAGASVVAALDTLLSGKAVLRKVTIPEGLTSREAVALIDAAEGLTGSTPIPPEGSILPETYTYGLNESRESVIARMRAAMDETLAELWENRAPDLPVKTPEEALVLASIVEKETGLAAERPRVAAVFTNRLRRGMRMQSDPTVIYAITKGERDLGRALRFKDLEIKDPYNTYWTKALPPGPICNPGRDALAAVLNPITSKELYFVADGTGGHAFAKTLKEHNRNVEHWRKVQREQRRKARQQQQ